MIGFYSWYSVDSKCVFPWLGEIREHVDPLLKTPKKEGHMALRQLMKRVYEKSLNGLWISTGTYYLFPSQHDRLESLRLVVANKEGIDLHYVAVYESDSQLQSKYLERKYQEYFNRLYSEDFESLVQEFLLLKKAYVMHKIENLIKHTKSIESELADIGILMSYAAIMQSDLNKALEKI